MPSDAGRLRRRVARHPRAALSQGAQLICACALDDGSVAKVADFGTVRVDTRNTDGKLRTSAQTHASTARIVGTKPYMPNEYTRKGHVSEKTDSFAMGILVSKRVERSEKSECSNSLVFVLTIRDSPFPLGVPNHFR